MWNSKIIGKDIPDLFSVDVTASSSVGVGASVTYSINLLTRGKSGISITATEQWRNGVEIDYGINFNIANYIGNTSNINHLSILGAVTSISGGWGIGGQGFLEYNTQGYRRWVGAGVGIGLTYGISWGNGTTRVIWNFP